MNKTLVDELSKSFKVYLTADIFNKSFEIKNSSD